MCIIFFAAVAVGCFRMAAIPLLRGIMSKMTPPHKQGISYISKCKKNTYVYFNFKVKLFMLNGVLHH